MAKTIIAMNVSHCCDYEMIEFVDESELARWRPSPGVLWQFARVDNEIWLFHQGEFLGVAGQIWAPEGGVWQASSRDGEVCIAPLNSPLECARRLIEHRRAHRA